MSAIREAMLRVEQQEAEDLRKPKTQDYDPEEPLLLCFRHGTPEFATMIELVVPDLVVGEILMRYVGPSRLVQRTAHSDIRRVVRETAHT